MKECIVVNSRLILLFFLSLASCSDAQEKKLSKQRNLIVYLSRTNNTKALAEIIRDQAGGDLVQIELSKPYPADYKTTVAQVSLENESGFLPLLKTRIENMAQYDVVFLGFPTWGMRLPPPVKSFLRQYDFNGKTIIPFNSNAGYGVGSTFDEVKSLCPESKVLDGFSIKGGVERDGELLVIKDAKRKSAESAIVTWLKKLKMIAPAENK